jgi:hypothetical protein
MCDIVKKTRIGKEVAYLEIAPNDDSSIKISTSDQSFEGMISSSGTVTLGIRVDVEKLINVLAKERTDEVEGVKFS